MKILDHLMTTLDFDTSVKEIRQGVFHTAVVTRTCGLAATLIRDALTQSPPLVREPGFLTDRSARELAKMAYSESLLEAAMGMAAINSLISIDPDRCLELNAADLILERAQGRRVVIVGHFPFVPKVREKAKALWVIDKNPKPGDVPGDETDRFIPLADVVAITGTALTNHSLPELLDLCNPNAFVILLGDSAPLSPVFFDHGVDAVCGTQVTDTALAMRCLSQGANFRQIQGTRRLILMKE